MLAHGDVLRSDVIDVWNSFSYEQQNAIKLALLCGRAGNSTNLPGTPSCQQTATQMLIWEFVTGARHPRQRRDIYLPCFQRPERGDRADL